MHAPHSEIIPLDRIVKSCHLIPNFRNKIDLHWTADTVLEQCNSFFLSRWTDMRTFYFLQ